MGWFSDIFSPEVLLPIAAGIAFGPGGMMLAKGTAGTAALAGAAAGLLGGDLAGASLLSEDLLDGASLLSDAVALLGDADLLGDDAAGFSIFSTFFLASILSLKLVKLCCISPRHIGQFFF